MPKLFQIDTLSQRYKSLVKSINIHHSTKLRFKILIFLSLVWFFFMAVIINFQQHIPYYRPFADFVRGVISNPKAVCFSLPTLAALWWFRNQDKKQDHDNFQFNISKEAILKTIDISVAEIEKSLKVKIKNSNIYYTHKNGEQNYIDTDNPGTLSNTYLLFDIILNIQHERIENIEFQKKVVDRGGTVDKPKYKLVQLQEFRVLEKSFKALFQALDNYSKYDEHKMLESLYYWKYGELIRKVTPVLKDKYFNKMTEKYLSMQKAKA